MESGQAQTDHFSQVFLCSYHRASGSGHWSSDGSYRVRRSFGNVRHKVLAWGFLSFRTTSTRIELTNHGLPPVRNVHMLDRDALLSGTA